MRNCSGGIGVAVGGTGVGVGVGGSGVAVGLGVGVDVGVGVAVGTGVGVGGWANALQALNGHAAISAAAVRPTRMPTPPGSFEAIATAPRGPPIVQCSPRSWAATHRCR